jgi:hypothetical protein
LSISSDNGVLAIEDTEYKLSDAVERAIKNKCLKALEVGKQYELYFDMYNRVFYYELIEESEGYGYVTKVYTDGAGDKNHIKMFCADDVWRTIELREKITCDKVPVKSKDFVKTAVLKELVKYELDTKGKLKSIEYPILTDVEDPKYMDYIKDESFTKVNINNERWLLNTMSFEGKYYTSKLEYVFSIPEDGNEDEFKMIGFLPASEARYSLAMYELDEFSHGKIAVQTATDALGLNYLDNLMVVDKVITAYVEDEIVSVVYGFMNGQNVSFTGKDEHTFSGLKRGDIIRTKYNYGSKATGYEAVHTFGNETEITKLETWEKMTNITILKGFASSVDYSGGRIRMNDILSGITCTVRNDTVITVYDSINGEAKNGTINDLMTGDYIILRLRGGYFHELLIIKK